MIKQPTFAPGSRLIIRDAEWLVRKVDRTSTGGQAVAVVGLSELVRDKDAVFLTEIDSNIEVLDPVETKYVGDSSTHYRDSLLYIESLLRQTPPTDEKLYIGHRAAMDLVPYQLEPALQSLQHPRQRILIADAVGLGKTIEAGILLAELIKRGRGRRILVLTVKSMLTQFQKELWSRFTIPLTRLDSVGIQRIRSRIPSNHNPFFYYDKSIISIDTLKQDAEYRTYLENSYWDIIVIDEAHNVAERGSRSLRSRLAKLLASRSDTLIMLSATPHDGKPRAFASLMNMLNPTAIADPENYTKDDIKGLFIRRFKKDIKAQVAHSFRERKIAIARAPASPEEENVYNTFVDLSFAKLDQRRSGDKLFKTTLEKSLFSSPRACLQTIHNRLRGLKDEKTGYETDIAALEQLSSVVDKITPTTFSKYQKLLEVITDRKHGLGWTGQDPNDRLVIFTERIDSLKFLLENLKRDLSLNETQIAVLHGSEGAMSDMQQQEIVEDFGKEISPIRLLIASDIASEGINLHYLSHKMIHFDIPWSLMVFQQRNGRIDRYGQEREPLIVYLVTESENPKIKGDTRILELLIQKDEQAVKNIGDPSSLMGVYDIEQEEMITAKAIEQGASDDDFEALLAKSSVDPMAILLGGPPDTGQNVEQQKASMPSLFQDDLTYLKEAVGYIQREQTLQTEFDLARRFVTLTPTKDIEYRFRFLPKEIWPDSGQFILTDDCNVIMQEMKRCRQEEKAWPKIHLLWEQHPVIQWVNDKVVSAFGRREAPVLSLSGALVPDEVIFIVSGVIPNRRSHPLIHRWLGVRFLKGRYDSVADFESLVKKTRLGAHRFANRNTPVPDEKLQDLAPAAVDKARTWMAGEWKQFESSVNEKLNEQLAELERLKAKKFAQLELRFEQDGSATTIKLNKKDREKREIERIFSEYLEWIEETMTTENNPYIRIVAVLKGDD